MQLLLADPKSYGREKQHIVKNKFCVASLTDTVKLINEFDEKVSHTIKNYTHEYQEKVGMSG